MNEGRARLDEAEGKEWRGWGGGGHTRLSVREDGAVVALHDRPQNRLPNLIIHLLLCARTAEGTRVFDAPRLVRWGALKENGVSSGGAGPHRLRRRRRPDSHEGREVPEARHLRWWWRRRRCSGLVGCNRTSVALRSFSMPSRPNLPGRPKQAACHATRPLATKIVMSGMFAIVFGPMGLPKGKTAEEFEASEVSRREKVVASEDGCLM